MIGLVIGAVHIFLLLLTLLTNPSLAQDGFTFSKLFAPPNPEHDLAYMMMDLVFGIENVFNSCVTTDSCTNTSGQSVALFELSAENRWPFTVHEALHSMLGFYSTGLVVIGIIITLYFMFAVVVETAESGTPFGKRYNKVWAPVRLVVAFGLLIPLNHGISASQYIVLYAAKYGSAFASQGWAHFNKTLGEAHKTGVQTLVAKPNPPELNGLLQFMFTAGACAEAEEHYRLEYLDKNKAIEDPYKNSQSYTCDAPKPYDKDKNESTPKESKNNAPKEALPVLPYLVLNNNHIVSHKRINPDTSYEDMMKFLGNDDQFTRQSRATIRFGRCSKVHYPQHTGFVEPTCGELDIPLNYTRLMNKNDNPNGVALLQRYYWFIIKEIWDWFSPEAKALAENVIKNDKNFDPKVFKDFARTELNFYGDDLKDILINPSKTGIDDPYFRGDVGAVDMQSQNTAWTLNMELKKRGWAAAGIWYNTIAEMNGALTAAVFNIPTPVRFPKLSEEIAAIKRANNEAPDIETRFSPTGLPPEAHASYKQKDIIKAGIMHKAYSFFNNAGGSVYTQPTGNAVIDLINTIFGTEGLLNMRDNKDVHPLAQLTGIGKALVDSTIYNIGAILTGSFAGIITDIFKNIAGDTAKAISGFIVSVTMVALSVGVILFYVIPFLPFIYFFFAVGGWVKGIFEALIGAPLWALAHIRIDGNGLPGQQATNGYYLILEIFIRPILTIFGLIASVSIFGAMVSVLNDIWDLAVQNLGGKNTAAQVVSLEGASDTGSDGAVGLIRSGIDPFFYTIVYAIAVYKMGMSSFKLIDDIPNQITRWMGQNVQSFNDGRQDPAGQMVQSVQLGSNQVTDRLGGGLKGIAGLMGKR